MSTRTTLNRSIRFLAALLIVLLGIVLVGGCREQSGIRGGRLRVVTTFLPVYIFTKNVAGDVAEVRNIVPPGVGVHDYQFKPQDVKNVSDADVVVKNGLGAEMWLDKLLKSTGKDVAMIDTSQGISGVNVHIWLDPVRVVRQVENIRDGLSKKDPKNKNIYKKNAARFVERIRKLDQETRREVAGFRTRDFVAFHSAFVYFSDRYGLNQVATIEQFPGKEPNPRYLANISRIVKERHLKALFTEPQYSPRIVESLASDLGIKILVLDPIETGELKADYWERIMRKNVSNLKQAMGE